MENGKKESSSMFLCYEVMHNTCTLSNTIGSILYCLLNNAWGKILFYYCYDNIQTENKSDCDTKQWNKKTKQQKVKIKKYKMKQEIK